MKRIIAMVAIGIALLTLLSACGPSSSQGETSNEETPSGTINSEFDMEKLMIGLIDQGVSYGIGDDVTQPFFSVAGQTIIVNRESVQVFTYASPKRKAEADLVDPTGFTVGTTSISWVAPPHFYIRDSLLVLYLGGNGPVINLLEAALGPQFAGAEPSSAEANSYVDDEVQTYLSLMVELASYLNAFTS